MYTGLKPFALLLLFFFTSVQSVAAQEVMRFPLKADAFHGIDDFDHYYYSRNQVLFKKINTAVLNYYDIQLGEITSVDLINPLKVLVFYKETQTIILLDNRLNELERIVLSDLEPYRYFSHVRLAGERRLWLFNQDHSVLELYNYIDHRTVSVTPIITRDIITMQADYNFCHLITKNGVLSFNTYGSQTNVLDLDTFDFITYDFEQLAVISNQFVQLYRWDKEFRFRESGTATLPEVQTSIQNLYLKAGTLYIWNGEQITALKLSEK